MGQKNSRLKNARKIDLEERFVASMVLSGVGDALGYRNGLWEFSDSGPDIHKEYQELGGIKNIHVKLPEWRVSDDTVMHLALAEAFTKQETCTDKMELYIEIAIGYGLSMEDMDGRSPGPTCVDGCARLRPNLKRVQIRFDPRGGGCGAAMRAMCLGLRYPSSEQLDDLIAVCVESARMTHHHPTAYLGALAAALFVSYALQGKPIREWGVGLMSTLPKAMEYVKDEGRDVEANLSNWSYFEGKWQEYLELRKITTGETDPVFPEKYGVEERDEFYKSVSWDGWGGASGHDAPMIAYDALLGCNGSWEELIKRGALHAGDSDSTAVMACAWYGAIFGFKGVPECNHKDLEYRERLANAGCFFYRINQQDSHCDKLPMSSGENIPVIDETKNDSVE